MPITRTLAILAALLAAFAGAFALAGPATAQAPVSQCNDGIDNDGDGTVDGADPYCQSEAGSAYGDIPSQVFVAVPTVTLQGTVSRRGVVDVTRLVIQGRRGTTVRISCQGKTCPVKNFVDDIVGRPSLRIKAFERKLRPSMTLTMRIAQKGSLGKLTRYKIRRGKPPVRTDTCLDAQTNKAIGCFSS